MRRRGRARAALLAMLAMLAMASVQAAEPGGAAAGNPFPPSQAGVDAGSQASANAPQVQARTLWKRHCGPCHLEGGTGTFMLGRRLGAARALLEQRTDVNAQYVRTVVRQGIQSMPRFSRAELPDEELDRIAQYLAASEK